jgi:ubiquitin carboxyl-terminal hydrolase 8
MEPINYNYDFHKYYELKIKKQVYIDHGLCGLINIGNKCFMSSILQCLFNSLKLTDYFLSNDYKEDINKKNVKENYILNSYITLINNIWDTNQLIKPKSFIENMGKMHRKYFSLQQQDSHECLLYILDILHNALSYSIDIEIIGQVKHESDRLTKKALETWKQYFENDYSYIIKIFYGNKKNTIKCVNTKCNYKDEIFEPYNSLSLNITESCLSLKDLLENYLNTEYTIDDYRCEKCSNIGCVKSTKLWDLSNYLVIHLKRFKSDNENESEKMSNMITFPLKDLNITEYICKDKKDVNNYIYDLYAVNYHIGEMGYGHYTSSCKNLDGNWYNYDDTNVTKYSSSNLEQHLINKDAYILFYQRKFIKSELTI